MKFIETANKISAKNNKGTICYLDLNLNNEVSPVGILPLVTKTKMFELQSYSSDCIMSNMQQLELESFNIDTKKIISERLKTEISKLIETDLINKYYQLGKKTSFKFATKWQSTFRKVFKKITYPIYSDVLDVNLRLMSSFIAASSRIGPANFLVTNTKIASIIASNKSFIYNTETNMNINIIEHFGIIYNMNVFIDHNLKEDKILFGRKNDGDQQLHGVNYVEGVSDIIKLPSMNLESKVIAKTDAAIIDTDNAELNYIERSVSIGKKPLWRKLLKL